MKTAADSLIERYMKELQNELRAFPAGRRREIADEVREHIAEARSEFDAETEAAIRTVLDRLGDPSEIAASARERLRIPAPRAGVLEAVGAVALLVPFIGWVGGTVLVWLSRVWTTRDKVLATIAVPGVWLIVLLGTIATHAERTVSGPGAPPPPGPVEPSLVEGIVNVLLAFLVPLGVILVPVAVAIYLLVRARNISDANAATG